MSPSWAGTKRRWRRAFKPETLQCATGQSGDQCLSAAQVKAIDTLHATYTFPFPLANGLDDYPGWGVSGEDTPPFGPTGVHHGGRLPGCGSGSVSRAR